MKNIISVICMVITMAAAASTANATSIIEEYTGSQVATGGDVFRFEFDLWYQNDNSIKTNSSLILTQDGEGAFGAWDSAFLFVDLYSNDPDKDKAKIILEAYDDTQSGTVYNLGTYFFSNNNLGNTLNLAYQFDSTMLDDFDDLGWGKIKIRAYDPANQKYMSNFNITRVAIEANVGGEPVPEPTTLMLMSTGLAGLVGWRRRRR